MIIIAYVQGQNYTEFQAVTIHWTGLDYWTGILDWTTGLKFFPFLDKIMWFFKYLTPGDLNHYF